MRFEWGFKKEHVNIKKHGLTFEEAREALTCGTVVVLRKDNDHNEPRFAFLGMCKRHNVLVVVVAYSEETVTRIISAKKATKSERKFYEAQLWFQERGFA
jgi:uncharacterized DUF497 family protein